MPEKPILNLGTIGNGAAYELFERELARILQNVRDPNTNPTKKRKMNLEFTFEPYNDRSGCAIEITVKSTLCATTGVNATMYISKVEGRLQAFTQDIRQAGLFDPKDDLDDEPQAVQPGSRTTQ